MLDKNFRRIFDTFTSYLFILPALVLYVLFVFLSIFKTLRYSLFDWDGASPKMKFVGLENYAKLLGDEIFWKALVHNVQWIVFTIIIPMTIGLILAVLVSRKEIRGKVLFRTTYFLPTILSTVVVSIIWTWIYHPEYGKLNQALRFIGLDIAATGWLGNPETVLWALVTAGGWAYYGFCMAIFMAAIQGIDTVYYEVARIEGANVLHTFFKVTIPLLKNTMTLMTLHAMILSFKVFDIVYATTRGGPYYSSEVISNYMFTKAFFENNVGYGAALAMMLGIFIALISIGYLRIVERGE